MENLGGHKLPTAYPSRRVWLHVTVRDRNGNARIRIRRAEAEWLDPGNDNDADAARFEPHYTEITSRDQVQIYESVMGDANGRDRPGLLTAVRFLKDNRLLPHGFDKNTAGAGIAVVGGAMTDPDFLAGAIGSAMRSPSGMRRVHSRWTRSSGISRSLFAGRRIFGRMMPRNLRRFVRYYDSLASSSAVMLARASVVK